MLQIHPNARTTPVTRAEIAQSHERTGGHCQVNCGWCEEARRAKLPG